MVVNNIRRILLHVLPQAFPVPGHGWYAPLDTIKLNTALKLHRMGAVIECDADHDDATITVGEPK